MVVAVLALSQPVTAEKKDSKDREKIKFCIADSRTEFVTFVAREAEDMGFFKKRGININFKKFGHAGGAKFRESGKLNKRILDYGVASEVARRNTDCPFGASNIERYLFEEQEGTLPLMVSYYGENYDTHLVVAKNSEIKSVKELAGGRLHVGQLPTRLAVERLLTANGVPLKTINLNGGLDGGAERLAGLESGEITAMTSYLPSMSYLLATDKVRILSANVVSRYLSPHVPHGLLVVNQQYAEENPKLVSAFVDAMNEAYEYILRNPAEILHVLLRHKNPRGDSWYNMTEAEVQKAATFVGKVKMVTVGRDPKVDIKLHCDVVNFGKEIVKHGYVDQTADLSGWLKIPAEKRNCGPAEKKVALAD